MTCTKPPASGREPRNGYNSVRGGGQEAEEEGSRRKKTKKKKQKKEEEKEGGIRRRRSSECRPLRRAGAKEEMHS